MVNKMELNIEGLTKMSNLADDLIRVKESEMENIDKFEIDHLFELCANIKDKVNSLLELDRTNNFIDTHLEEYR